MQIQRTHPSGKERSGPHRSTWAGENPSEAHPPLRTGQAPRAEKRDCVVRSFEYSHYPRDARQQQRLIGLTRDESKSGLCVVVDQPEPSGSLLQIALQTLDGDPSMQALAVVAWCRPREDGRYALGLSLIERTCRRRTPLRARHSSWERQVRLSA